MDYELPLAERHLRQAHETYQEAGRIRSRTSNIMADWTRIFSYIRLATESVKEAEKLDKYVAFELGTETITCQWMITHLIYLEASVSTSASLPEHAIRRGIATMQTYLSYMPRDVHAINELTLAYIRVYERNNAIALNRVALQYDPPNIAARQIRDRLTEDQNLGEQLLTPETYFGTPGAIEAVFSPALSKPIPDAPVQPPAQAAALPNPDDLGIKLCPVCSATGYRIIANMSPKKCRLCRGTGYLLVRPARK